MRKVLLVLPLLLLFVFVVNAQQPAKTMTPQDFWKYSPDLSDEDLYQYDRLLYMSKEDWELFRSDPRYDHERVQEIYREHKGKVDLAALAALKTLPPDDCNCWINPDDTYTEEDPTQWDNCGGGGAGVDCWIGPLNLPFTFCFYGQDFNQIYLTTKGTIAFGSGYFDWTPTEFPTPVNPGDPQYDHVAGFWADFDFRPGGEMHYKITDNAFYLNYIGVGYWNNHNEKTNTFQIIIAESNSGVLTGDNNVQFCYLDMDWAHGDVGGGGGFSGPSPATVGADRLAGTSHIQFGRFNLPNSNYNGPYGQANNQQDGVDWLDNQVFEFSTCAVASNIPPIPTSPAPCDTIYLCQGDVYDLSMSFLSPETGQTTNIQYNQSGTGLTASVSSGNTANLNGSFTASMNNLGVNTVTITATDTGNPAGTTELEFIFFVQDITAPPISISGDLAICAGGETLLSATPGFDSYSWSSGCFSQDCLVEFGGDVTVTGFVGTCTSTATVFVDASDYFIPDLVSDNEPIILCPGVEADICLVDEWASYSWDVYPGYPGEIEPGVATDEQCLTVSGDTPGHYRVIVEDEFGCQGFNIQLVEIIESFIDEENDNNSGAYCDGFETVVFDGGFSNPAEGTVTVYLLSSSSFGWQGSYLNVVVTHTDGTTDQYTMTSGNTFTIASAPITLDDEICITYVSSGVGDANNTVWIFNCSNQGQTIIGPGLTPGQIWCGTSGCTAQPLFGAWTVNGPTGWTMTNMDEYNTEFTPTQYGLYTLCFNDPACSIDHCYELEFTLPPTIELIPGNDILLCDSETAATSIEITDIANSGTITWSGQGVEAATDLLSATVGPYTGYVNTAISASITNGCGTSTDTFNVIHQPDVPEPNLTDQFLCNGGSLILDPIPVQQDNPALEYDWTPNNTGSTFTITQSGTYSVIVSNDCDSSNEVSADVVLVPAATLNPTPPASILECDNDQVQINVGVPIGYSITWNSGQNVSSINVDESGSYCYTVTDNAGCDTEVAGCVQVTIASDPIITQGSSDIRILCPGECEEFDLASPNATSYNWSSSCSTMPMSSNGGVLTFCSDQVPAACLDGVITITGTATNVCGTASASWNIAANACKLTVPNVFTPNGDALNANFFIYGLENYPGTKLYVFNRWGAKIYESENYQNDWGPRDLNEGTYYYIIELPFGIEKLIEGSFTILK